MFNDRMQVEFSGLSSPFRVPIFRVGAINYLNQYPTLQTFIL